MLAPWNVREIITMSIFMMVFADSNPCRYYQYRPSGLVVACGTCRVFPCSECLLAAIRPPHAACPSLELQPVQLLFCNQPGVGFPPVCQEERPAAHLLV